MRKIGILIDSYEDLCEYEICQGIIKYFSLSNIQVIVFEAAHNFRLVSAENQYIKLVEMVNNSDISGLIVFSMFFLDHISLYLLKKYILEFKNMHIISIGLKVNKITSLEINEKQSLYDLVDYLIKTKEVTKVKFMFGPQSNIFSQSRLNYIIDRFKSHGILFNDNDIHHLDSINLYDAQMNTSTLLDKSILPPQAIVCFDDYIASGVLEYIEVNRTDLIDKIIITGFDNIPLKTPRQNKILTIDQPFYEMGMKAGKLLSCLIDNEPTQYENYINSTLELNKEEDILKLFQKESKRVEKDYTLLRSNKFIKEVIHKLVTNFKCKNKDSKKYLLELFYSMDLDEIIDEPVLIKIFFRNYLNPLNLDLSILTDIKSILETGISIIYSEFGAGSILFQMFSFSLDCIKDTILNYSISEKYKQEDYNWRNTIGGQLILRCRTYNELLSNLTNFCKEFRCNDFFLFLYKRETSNLIDLGESIPDKTELVFSFKNNKSSFNSIIFNSSKILPDWKILNTNTNYIFIMLFYNKTPIGYMFLNLKPNEDPKKYISIRINLENAIHNILRIEKCRESYNKQNDYYINKINQLKSPIQQIILEYDLIKKKADKLIFNNLRDSVFELLKNINSILKPNENYKDESGKNEEKPKSISAKESNKSTLLLIESNYKLRKSFIKTLCNNYTIYDYDFICNVPQKLFDTAFISIIIGEFPAVNSKNYREQLDYYERLCKKGFLVYFVLNSFEQKSIIKALNCGAIDYFIKPFLMESLLLKIRNNLSIQHSRKNTFIKKFEDNIISAVKDNNLAFRERPFKSNIYLEEKYNLNRREIELIELITQKKYHREIADILCVTEQTVKNMSHGIYKKLNVSGKKELLQLIAK